MRQMLILVATIALLWQSGSWLYAQDKLNESGDSQTQVVVAEGVGITAEEALKDAYRNAVRQVVGAVVDAETMVKNDELIEDKVLTYSDGFIKTYKEIPGSKKMQGGLHRIKITAQVERRNVIARLKAANVTMKQVDGKGLFAEVTTQMEATADAGEILKKQFEGFPQSCITATIKGKPELINKSASDATLRITVQVEPDLEAYKAFSARVIPIIGTLAIKKNEITPSFEKSRYNSDILPVGALEERNHDNFPEWFPQAFEERNGSTIDFLKKDILVLAIASNRTKACDKIEYQVFYCNPELTQLLNVIASRIGKGKLTLTDAGGETIVSEKFDLKQNIFQPPYSSESHFAGTLFSSFGKDYNYSRGVKEDKVFLVSPTFFSVQWGPRLAQIPQLLIPIDLKLSLDEVKSIQNAKVEISFDE